MMMGMAAVAGLRLMALVASTPFMPGMRWSMKITSGCCSPFRKSRASSAEPAMLTSMLRPSRSLLSANRATLESSTSNAVLMAI